MKAMKSPLCTWIAFLLTICITSLAQGQVTIDLTPMTYPIVLPDSGGSFDYLLTVTNQGGAPITAMAWCMVTLPDGSSWGPVVGPATQTLGAGQTQGYYRVQSVPPRAAEGYYALHAYVGIYPDTIWAQDQFEFQHQAVSGTEQLWVARYEGPGGGNDYAHNVVLDAAGNVYVAGRCSGATSQWDYGTIKYDPSGYQVWSATYDGPGSGLDYAASLAVDALGNVYVTGRSEGSGTNWDYATVKYGPSGNQLWAARYNGPQGLDYAEALALDAAGNVYVTGLSWGLGTDYDYTTIKYDANGNQIWVVRYNGPGNYYDCPSALALDGAGNVCVTGTSTSGASVMTCDYATVKYDPSGNQIWVARYNGPGNQEDEALALDLDGSGNVFVTGSSLGGFATNSDYATIKYDASGNQLWVARYDGPENGWDKAVALDTDGSGNVFVTGWSTSVAGEYDYTTLKYDASGNQLWVSRYDGPMNSTDQAAALVADSEGHVYVTGASIGLGTASDYATVKYDASGNQLWTARYNGPWLGTDAAWAIALDGGGGVCVTGSCMNPGYNEDYATIKYSGGEIANWLPVEATVLGQPLPKEFALHQNYPNPFNGLTALSYQLSASSHVLLQVYDTAGRLVTTLLDRSMPPGIYRETFSGSGLASGMYIYRLQAGNYSATGKMVLMK